MIDRKRLAVAGAALTVSVFVAHVLLSWIDYQRALDANQPGWFWAPNYWEHFRSGAFIALPFLFAIGVGMVVMAIAMRAPEIRNDSPIRAEPPDDTLFRPDA